MSLSQSLSSDLCNSSELRFLSEVALPNGWLPGDGEISSFTRADAGLKGLDSDPPRMSLLMFLDEALPDGRRPLGGETSGVACSVSDGAYLDGLDSVPPLMFFAVLLAWLLLVLLWLKWSCLHY